MDIVYSAINEPKRALDYEYLFVCGSNKLKKKLNYDVKKVLSSDYVKLVYGNQFNSKDCVKNQEMIIISNGLRMVFQTTMAQDPKGSRYKRIYLTDYFTGKMFRSKADRETGFENLGAILTRTQVAREGVNEDSNIRDIVQTKLIVDNQRLGRGDVAERFIENYSSAGVSFFLCYFPYQFDENFKDADKRTYSRLNNKGEVLETYIYEENQFVVKRFNEKTKRKLIADQGEKRYKVEYQGLVDSVEGEILYEDDFAIYTEETLKNTYINSLVITIDTATSTKNTADYTVISLWAFNNQSVFLIDLVQGRWLFNEFENRLTTFISKWQYGVNGKPINDVIIENTNAGQIVLQQVEARSTPTAIAVRRLIPNISGVNPVGGKYERISAHLTSIKMNKIYIPSPNTSNQELNKFVLAFKQQCLEFTPNNTHQHDDMVDTMIMAFEYFRKPKHTITLGYQAGYKSS